MAKRLALLQGGFRGLHRRELAHSFGVLGLLGLLEGRGRVRRFVHQRLQGVQGEGGGAATVLEPLGGRVHGALGAEVRQIIRGRSDERHILRHEAARRPLGDDVRRPRGDGHQFLDILAGGLLPEERGQLIHAVGALLARARAILLIPPAAVHHRLQEGQQLLRRLIVEVAGSSADAVLELLGQVGADRLRRRTPGEDPDQLVGAHLAHKVRVLRARERLQGSAPEPGQSPQTTGHVFSLVLARPPEAVAHHQRELLGLFHDTTVPRYGAASQGVLEQECWKEGGWKGK